MSEFRQKVWDLMEEQGTTKYVKQALEEMELSYVDDVTYESFFIERCKALREEDA